MLECNVAAVARHILSAVGRRVEVVASESGCTYPSGSQTWWWLDKKTRSPSAPHVGHATVSVAEALLWAQTHRP
jgi:hypothetical protein